MLHDSTSMSLSASEVSATVQFFVGGLSQDFDQARIVRMLDVRLVQASGQEIPRRIQTYRHLCPSPAQNQPCYLALSTFGIEAVLNELGTASDQNGYVMLNVLMNLI